MPLLVIVGALLDPKAASAGSPSKLREPASQGLEVRRGERAFGQEPDRGLPDLLPAGRERRPEEAAHHQPEQCPPREEPQGVHFDRSGPAGRCRLKTAIPAWSWTNTSARIMRAPSTKMITSVTGTVEKFGADVLVEGDDLSKASVEFWAEVASVTTGSPDRDKHLKSQDFFNAKEYPTITFQSTKIEKAGEGYKVTGDLTLRGVTKKVNAKARHTGTANLMERFGLRTGYEATLDIDRTDFGMDYWAEGGAIGSKVQIIIALEGMVPAEKKPSGKQDGKQEK